MLSKQSALIVWLIMTQVPFIAPAKAEQQTKPATVFDDLVMQDQEGHLLPLSKYKGKTVLINFIFTRCGSVCPLQTQRLVAVQKQIPATARDTIQFLSVSVDPEHDTSKQLKTYAEARGVDFTNWSFVMGDKKTIAKFTQLLGVFDPRKKNPTPADHATQLYLFDKQSRLMQRYNGVAIDKDRIANEMQVLDTLGESEVQSNPSTP